MNYTLRPYQERGMAMTWDEIKAGVRALLLVAACGAGKTVLASFLTEQFVSMNRRVLFIAHTTELVEQCSRKFTECGIHHGRIKAGLDPLDRRAPVQVASIQTYMSRKDHLKHWYDVIIIDEAHRAVANQYMEMYSLNGSPLVIGLTATPYRTDGKGLGHRFQKMIKIADTADLIRDGFLVRPRLFKGTQRANFNDVPIGDDGDYDADILAARMMNRRITGDIIATWNKYAFGRKSIYFGCNVAHSKHIAEAFCANGTPFEHVDANTPEKVRKDIFYRLEHGDLIGITNCGIAIEGVDIPPVSCIGQTRRTNSRRVWRQSGGRGLRTCEGKYDCLLMDHAQLWQIHGYLTDPDDCDLSLGLAKEQPARCYTCKSCGAELASRPPTCPACGAVIPPAPENYLHPGLGNGMLEEDVLGEPLHAQDKPRNEIFVPKPPLVGRISRMARR